ncbi:MAG: hypothetical protein AAGJ53_07590 [Pseudomonadota bacterium]
MFWIFAAIVVAGFVPVIISLVRTSRAMWQGTEPHDVPLLFVDTAMAVSPTVLSHPLPDGYRLSSLYFGAGLIDRTRTLDLGFPYEIMDDIPALGPAPADFASLCAERAGDLVAEARATNKKLHVLWSGGIDSTTALAALLTALGNETDRLVVFMNAASRKEYPKFFKTHVKRLKTVQIKTVGAAFKDDAIVVTGEHGDQLFGSAKALEHSISGIRRPWETALPVLLAERLASGPRADAVVAFLEPQLARAPVPLPDLFTCLWWLNYSMKWQAVSLRMYPSSGLNDVQLYCDRAAHFFQTIPFELWALSHAGEGVRDDWATYKWPARDVIRDFTRDAHYASTKEKVPSLKGLVPRRFHGSAVAIDMAGATHWQPRDQTLREKRSSDGNRYRRRREDGLWNDMSDGE